jgi:hypothetical protein
LTAEAVFGGAGGSGNGWEGQIAAEKWQKVLINFDFLSRRISYDSGLLEQAGRCAPKKTN